MGSILEGVYVSGIAGTLFVANLLAPHREGTAVMLALLGPAALAGAWLLARALWHSFTARVLTLGPDVVTLERRLRDWKSAQRLPTSRIENVQILCSWRSRKKRTIHVLEFTAGHARLRVGHDLTWEENYWLCEEAKAFLARAASTSRGVGGCA